MNGVRSECTRKPDLCFPRTEAVLLFAVPITTLPNIKAPGKARMNAI